MKVCILGCGPAGLLAAYAAQARGCEVAIISTKVKSKIPGAVFLHEAIPGLTSVISDGSVRFIKHGTRRGYAAKVYGNMDADCSWDLFVEGVRPAWSMFKLYDELWAQFESRIHEEVINAVAVDRYLYAGFDLLISTIPAPYLCHNDEHKFDSQTIYVLDKTVDPSLENGIVYNGSFADNWYRTSKLFGAEATEATVPFDPNLISALGAKEATGYKPLKTNCDCLPQVERVGRFGRWEKGILVHHAYKQTVRILEART